jgi:GNAT superfamily N-acetyltransferase
MPHKKQGHIMPTQLEGIQINAAALDELHHTAQLRHEMAVEMGHNWDKDHPGWRDRFCTYFGQRHTNGLTRVIHAKTNERVIAIAIFSMIDDYHGYVRGKTAARVNCVYVAPDFRRKGIARAVMLAGLDWLKDQSCTVVRLNSSEEGAHLYRSIGFVPRNEMEFFL